MSGTLLVPNQNLLKVCLMAIQRIKNLDYRTAGVCKNGIYSLGKQCAEHRFGSCYHITHNLLNQ
jgi:hypothetical protein